MRIGKSVLGALLLALLLAATAQATDWSPLTAAEGEALLAEAIRYATINWQLDDQTRTGVPYVWGGRITLDQFLSAVEAGSDLQSLGVDASGLVVSAARAVFPHIKFRMARGDGFILVDDANSSSLYAYNVQPVSLEELQPGDLIFFGTDGRIDGVAIYERVVGRSIRFVVASASSGKVVQTGANLDGEYWRTRFAGAGRLLRGE